MQSTSWRPGVDSLSLLACLTKHAENNQSHWFFTFNICIIPSLLSLFVSEIEFSYEINKPENKSETRFHHNVAPVCKSLILFYKRV